MYRLKAFTLLELVVVMLISAIIVSLMFLIANNVEKVYRKFSYNQNGVVDLLLFRTTLENDIDNAITINRANNATFQFITESDTITYSFKSKIFRNKFPQVDSFAIETSDLQYEATPSFDKVRRISFNIVQPFSIDRVTFIKCYTSADFIH